MPYITSRTHDKNAKRQAIDEIVNYSRHSKSFYVLLVGAAILTLGGIFSDSLVLLIASMIVAPLAYPILALGFAASVKDGRLFIRTAFLMLLACLLVLAIAIIATYFFHDMRIKNTSVTFNENFMLSFVVALVSGAIAAYGTLQPKIATALTGIAIAVSLLPPLAEIGIGFASLDWPFMNHGAAIFDLNILGIFISSFIIFKYAKMNKEYRESKES